MVYIGRLIGVHGGYLRLYVLLAAQAKLFSIDPVGCSVQLQNREVCMILVSIITSCTCVHRNCVFTVMCNLCIIEDLHQPLEYMTMCVCLCVCMCACVCVLVCVHVCVSLYWPNTCGTAKQMLRFLFQN